jgi:hypothetical protein
MKSSIFWDITPCSPLKVKTVLFVTFFMLLPWLILRPWRWIQHFPPKLHLTFNELHGLISQKEEFCITTALRTSNSIRYDDVTSHFMWNAFNNLRIKHFTFDQQQLMREVVSTYLITPFILGKWTEASDDFRETEWLSRNVITWQACIILGLLEGNIPN